MKLVGTSVVVFVHCFIKKRKKYKKSNILHLCGFIFFISVKEASIPDYISFPSPTLKASVTKLGRNGTETTTSPVTCVGLRSTYLLNICLVYLSDIHENAWRGCSTAVNVEPAECEANALTYKWYRYWDATNILLFFVLSLPLQDWEGTLIEISRICHLH